MRNGELTLDDRVHRLDKLPRQSNIPSRCQSPPRHRGALDRLCCFRICSSLVPLCGGVDVEEEAVEGFGRAVSVSQGPERAYRAGEHERREGEEGELQ
jgi:hypothetical protein